MKRILVTGGAGYIGSQTCQELARHGFEPVVYDNLSRGHRWAVRWGPLVEGNLLDTSRLAAALRESRAEAVFHFAGLAYVDESVREPQRYYLNNVAGSLSLFQAMQEAGVPNLIFSSTCATYGDPKDVPIVEETPQKPMNPYGRGKWMVEQALKDLASAQCLNSISLRYFNAAGADATGELGPDHTPETRLIPLALRATQGAPSAPLRIFGTDYPTPDGTCLRDYIHVSDLATAHVRALESLARRPTIEAQAYNLGLGRGYSVREVVAAVERVTGQTVKIKECPRRPGDPPILFASAEKAQRELGWMPRYTQLDEIVATAWEWERAKLNKI